MPQEIDRRQNVLTFQNAHPMRSGRGSKTRSNTGETSSAPPILSVAWVVLSSAEKRELLEQIDPSGMSEVDKLVDEMLEVHARRNPELFDGAEGFTPEDRKRRLRGPVRP